MLAIIGASPLTPKVKEPRIEGVPGLAEAEAKVHGTSPEEVHFHEWGPRLHRRHQSGPSSWWRWREWSGWYAPLNVGSGTVKCAHGVLPVPAPATLELLEGLPVYAEGSPAERVTPTGASLVKCLADEFGPLPAGRVLASGRGLGDRESDIPNLLVRCWWRPRTMAKRTDSGGTGRRPGDEHRRHESPSTTVR